MYAFRFVDNTPFTPIIRNNIEHQRQVGLSWAAIC
jgi:hypothetical protein